MSAPKYTERDLVMARREGYLRGRGTDVVNLTPVLEKNFALETLRLFPLPKVTRRRVADDPHDHSFLRFRIGEDGSQAPALEASVDYEPFRLWPLHHSDLARYVTPARARLFADLFANPTEEVEGDPPEKEAEPSSAPRTDGTPATERTVDLRVQLPPLILRCNARTASYATEVRCERDAGHEGAHRYTLPTGWGS